jgi:hypothetical protein
MGTGGSSEAKPGVEEGPMSMGLDVNTIHLTEMDIYKEVNPNLK